MEGPCLGREQQLWVWIQAAHSRKLHDTKHEARGTVSGRVRMKAWERKKEIRRKEQRSRTRRRVSYFNLPPPQKGVQRELQVQQQARKIPRVCPLYVEGWCQVMAELLPEEQGLGLFILQRGKGKHRSESVKATEVAICSC